VEKNNSKESEDKLSYLEDRHSLRGQRIGTKKKRIRHKQSFRGCPMSKYIVPLNAPINIAHTSTSTVDYLYVKDTTQKRRTKTYIFGIYSSENLKTLKNFLEKAKGN
jgi:hypothetical protein